MNKVAVLFLAGLGLVGCDDSLPTCAPGEVRYVGRPARQVFAHDSSCRGDCFSNPVGSCEESCEPVAIADALGTVINERDLSIIDATSLGGGNALVYRFRYIDEAGGDAPAGFGFGKDVPRNYAADNTFGTARFVMETAVVELSTMQTSVGIAPVPAAYLADVTRSVPGRLEIERYDDRLVGRFFLAYESLKEQPQGEVLGCFDLSLSGAGELDGDSVRILSP